MMDVPYPAAPGSRPGPEPGAGAGGTALLVAAAPWFVRVQVSGALAVGYRAGGQRARIGDVTAHELCVRDTADGLLACAATMAPGAPVVASGVGSAVNADAQGGRHREEGVVLARLDQR